MNIIERIARVLAGQQFSRNASGEGPADVPAADLVDLHWPDHVDDAVAVLKTLREPDDAMRAAGDAEMWEAMVRAAIGEEA